MNSLARYLPAPIKTGQAEDRRPRPLTAKRMEIVRTNIATPEALAYLLNECWPTGSWDHPAIAN